MDAIVKKDPTITIIKKPVIESNVANNIINVTTRHEHVIVRVNLYT